MTSTLKVFKDGIALIKETKWNELFKNKKWDYRQIIWPFRVLFHPVVGFQEIKYEKKGSPLLAVAIFALVFISSIFTDLEGGFLFNYSRPENFNIWMVFMRSIMPLVLWCIANWSICTLMDGEGTFREIWVCTAYSFMPLVIKLIPFTIISKFLTLEEGAFLSIADTVAWTWVFILLIVSNMIIHQYTMKKNIFSLILTVFGIIVIMFLLVLLFSLFQQLFTFITTISNELIIRM